MRLGISLIISGDSGPWKWKSIVPTFRLGNLTDATDAYRAECEIMAVMAWPADEPARDRYIATIMAHNLGRLKRSANELPNPHDTSDWFGTIEAIEIHEERQNTLDRIGAWLEEAGDLLNATGGPGLPSLQKEVGSRLPAWFAAGLILALIRRMATHHSDLPGGASLNKAVFILEQAKFYPCPKNSNDIRRAWNTFKPVSHFCAALFDVFVRDGPDGFPTAEGGTISSFLADAEAYQLFGQSYIPPRAQGRAVLAAATTWLLPPERQWEPTHFVPAPLEGTLLAIAKTYRAPVPSA